MSKLKLIRCPKPNVGLGRQPEWKWGKLNNEEAASHTKCSSIISLCLIWSKGHQEPRNNGDSKSLVEQIIGEIRNSNLLIGSERAITIYLILEVLLPFSRKLVIGCILLFFLFFETTLILTSIMVHTQTLRSLWCIYW